jgi:UDP-glucose 4-epimerase
MKKENNIVITGACGHIGSALIERFHWQKYFPYVEDFNITAVDNMLTQRYTSLFNLNTKIKFYESNFLDIDLPEGGTVIHLGAITDAASSVKNSSQVEEININQTKQFIDKCIESKVKRFIFPSSTSVYGSAADVVFEDDEKYENPQSPYAQSKLEIEKYLQSNSGQMDYLILRFGTIFGVSKGMRFHTAINKFCWQASLDTPITIWKENYEQVRPYLGLTDATRCIKHFLLLDSSYYNTKYNVLTGNYKLSDIIGMIKLFQPNIKIQMVDTPLLNQFSYNVDGTKVKNTGFITTDDIRFDICETLTLLKNLR